MEVPSQNEGSEQPRKRTVTVIIENNKGEILLQLRDDKPTIPFPNQWYIPGGGIEEKDSTPEAAMLRELKEEMEIELEGVTLLSVYDWEDKEEFVFHLKLDLDLENTPVHEGQKFQYFSKAVAEKMDLAFHDNEIVRDFFTTRETRSR